MELTSQAINEAEFSMARRGYDPDQVDEFLEKLAVAVDKQNEALGEARERASMAERRAAEAERKLEERPERVVDVAPAAAPVAPAAPVADDGAERSAQLTAAAEAELETLQRTLLMAQKTADATVREAQEEARRMIAKAEDDARAAQEGTRARLLEEIGRLDTDRTALQHDVAALEDFLDTQRGSLRNTVADIERLLADPERLKATPAPEPTPVETAGRDAEPSIPEAISAGPPPAHELAPAEAGGAPEPSTGSAADPAAGEVDDSAWARFTAADDERRAMEADDDGGPPTQPVLRLDDLAPDERGGDDAYLSELRKAMLDDTGAPEGDDELDDRGGPRFGRRR